MPPTRRIHVFETTVSVAGGMITRIIRSWGVVVRPSKGGPIDSTVARDGQGTTSLSGDSC